MVYERLRFTLHVLRPRQRQLLADSALLIVTLIWGSTFVLVKDAAATHPVFRFLALRFGFATLAVLPLPWSRRRSGGPQKRSSTSALLLLRSLPPLLTRVPHRVWCSAGVGLALFAGFSFQTFGLRLTTPAKAGFITGLAVVIVPVGSALLVPQPAARNAWWGVGLATVGLALLTLQSDLSINPGDALIFGCGLAFAGCILLTGHSAPRSDPAGSYAGPGRGCGDSCRCDGRNAQVAPTAHWSRIVCCCVHGHLCHLVGFWRPDTGSKVYQLDPHGADLRAEPVFAALFSFLLIGEVLGARQLAGCGLILAGMVISEMVRNE